MVSVKQDTWNRKTSTLTLISAKSGKPVRVPAPDAVDRAMRSLAEHNALTLLVNSQGRPWKVEGFHGSCFRFIRKLEANGPFADGLTFHGLRHRTATIIRQLGCDTRTIANMPGQETEGTAAHGSHEADLEPKLRSVVKRLDLGE